MTDKQFKLAKSFATVVPVIEYQKSYPKLQEQLLHI